MSYRDDAELMAGIKDAADQAAGAGQAERIVRPRSPWPQFPEAAMSGLAGEIVQTIDPHTEADPVAVLLQFLGCIGSALGRKTGFYAEADFHTPNLYIVLVGATSKGRKGSSFGQARRPVEMADAGWKERITTGLNSGEGLVWAIRDREPGDEGEAGDADKRLMVVESEFASTLRVMSRDGNNLSAMLRSAWESGDLRTLTKNAPAKASGAHVSVIGHITSDELKRELTRTEAASGFANRILFACVRRSKQLPEGGQFQSIAWQPLVSRISAALDFGRVQGPVARSPEARELWAEVYGKLSEGRPGLLGAVTSRAEAQTMRLALIYAVLDRSAEIGAEHLRAALDLWAYCEASCEYVFGESLGDPLADEALVALRRAGGDGMTRNDLRDHFGRHKRSADLGRALGVLEEQGFALARLEQTGGRPAERWFAVTAHTAHTEGSAATPSGDGAVTSTASEPPRAESRKSAVSPDAADDQSNGSHATERESEWAKVTKGAPVWDFTGEGG